MTVFTTEMNETLRQLYVAGVPLKEIAEDLGVSEVAIRGKASRLGITNRQSKGRPYRELAIGESENGLSKRQAASWVSQARRDGLRLKRFVREGTLGLRRISPPPPDPIAC